MDYDKLHEDVRLYVAAYFTEHWHPLLVYHDLDHTLQVVSSTQKIANHYQLSDEDFYISTVAAYFHDAGYFVDVVNHENAGADLARQYLKERSLADHVIERVMRAIRSTKVPQHPEDLVEMVLCDGDLFHLGMDDFRQRAKLMHKETELLFNVEISNSEWRMKDILFLENHHYHTDYAQLLLNDQKQRNLEKLKNIMAQKTKPELTNVEIPKDKLKTDKPNRGIETMFRITSTNNQRLSDMADNKAQLLITVNSIILSLIVSILFSKLDSNTFLIVPTFMLLIVSLTCVVVSIISTRPAVPQGVFNESDIDNKKVNLLFFGNFYNMALDDYTKGMLTVMDDKEFLYGTLIKDVYSQGVVLGRKYKLIRLAYNIFMFGLVASTFGFIWAYLIANKM